jgi:hypothetical protein
MMRPTEVCTDPGLALEPRPDATDNVRVPAWFILSRVSVNKAWVRNGIEYIDHLQVVTKLIITLPGLL